MEPSPNADLLAAATTGIDTAEVNLIEILPVVFALAGLLLAITLVWRKVRQTVR